MLQDNPERVTPFKDQRPGKHWFQAFMRRHSGLSVRTPERVSKARAGVTERAIRDWFANLHTELSSMNALSLFEHPERVFNTDETCMQLAPSTGKVIGMKKWRNVYELAPGPEKSTLTFLGTFSASGEIPTPMIIYPYQRLPKDIQEKIPEDFEIGFSEKGWMTTATFYCFLGKWRLKIQELLSGIRMNLYIIFSFPIIYFFLLLNSQRVYSLA